MTRSLVLVAGSIALVAGLLSWLLHDEVSGDSVGRSGERETGTTEAPVLEPVANDAPVGERTSPVESIATAPPEVASSQAPTHTVHVRAVDLEGRPVEGASVFAAPPAHPLNLVAVTGTGGRLEFGFAGGDEDVELVVFAEHLQRGTAAMRVVRLSPGPNVVTFCVAAPTDGAWADLARSTERRRLRQHLENGGTLDEAILDLHASLEAQERTVRQMQRQSSFAPRSLRGTEPRADWIDDRTLRFTRSRGQGNPRPVADPIVAGADRDGAVAYVTGWIQSRPGEPAGDLPVRVEIDGGPDVIEGRTFMDGFYALIDVPVGSVRVVAGDGERGWVERTFEARAGEDIVWSPVIHERGSINGRVRGPDGLSVHAWRVVLQDDRGRTRRVAVTGRRGAFVLPQIADGSAVLTVAPPGRWDELPTLVQTLTLPTDDVLELAVSDRMLDGNELTGRVAPGSEVRLWNVGANQATQTQADPRTGDFRFSDVPTGDYLVEYGGDLGPWMRTELLQVSDDVVLGVLPEPPAGDLVVHGGPGRRLVERRGGLVVEWGVFEEELPVELRVDPGTYELRGPDGSVWSATVEPGGQATLGVTSR